MSEGMTVGEVLARRKEAERRRVSMRMLKYQISSPTSMEVDVKMPAGAVIRKVGLQGSNPARTPIFVWAEVPAGWHTIEIRSFRTVLTGGYAPEFATYLDTLFDGADVLHIYELERAEGL